MKEILCSELGIEIRDNMYSNICHIKLAVTYNEIKYIINLNINKLDLGIILQNKESLYLTLKGYTLSVNDNYKQVDNLSLSFNFKMNSIEILEHDIIYICTDAMNDVINYMLSELGYLDFNNMDIFILNYYWMYLIKNLDIKISCKKSMYIPDLLTYKILTDVNMLQKIKSETSISDEYYMLSELMYFDNFKILDHFRILDVRCITEYKYKNDLEILLSILNIYTLKDYIIYMAKGNPSIRRQFKEHGDIMEEAFSNIIRALGDFYDIIETGLC